MALMALAWRNGVAGGRAGVPTVRERSAAGGRHLGFHFLNPRGDLTVGGVDPVDFGINLQGFVEIALLSMHLRYVVPKPQGLVPIQSWVIESPPVPLQRQIGQTLVTEAEAEDSAALECAAGIARGELQLADRLVHQTHLLIGDSEVVVGVEVVRVDLLLDPLLESREDVLERMRLPVERILVPDVLPLLLLREARIQLGGQIEEIAPCRRFRL